jgi:hypothetical protein
VSVQDSIVGALQRFGRDMILRRVTLGPNSQQIPLDVVVKAVSKAVSDDKLIGSNVQYSFEITVTNSEIAAAQWPGPPRKNDKIVMDGKTRNVESVEPKHLANDVLVFVCRVTG